MRLGDGCINVDFNVVRREGGGGSINARIKRVDGWALVQALWSIQ